MQAVMERQAGSGDMCLSCHDGSVVDSRFKVWSTRHHTTDAVPSPAVNIPTDKFPLDAQGRMTCATCHTAHAVPADSDLRTVIFLRQPNVDSSLCLACHPQHAQKNDCQHPLGQAKPDTQGDSGRRRQDLPRRPRDFLSDLSRAARRPECLDAGSAPFGTVHRLPHGKAPEISPPAGAPVHRIGHTYAGFSPRPPC